MAQLTAREGEIPDLVAEGLSNQTIAVKLYVSRRTVESRSSTDRSWPDQPDRRSVGCTGNDDPRADWTAARRRPPISTAVPAS
ncbi:LuxR C-terminal-related transcriptional regulator [Streptomyces sp. NPDC086033]|uniref:LuxR C-terminal-related transcriptional regulator n=1 Tax=Streptomyces sp. NPDC086033 TaxID=3365747 RepID=UPI0037D6FC60